MNKEHNFHKGGLSGWNVDLAYEDYYSNFPGKDKLLTESQYREVVRESGELLAQRIADGHTVVLPERLGVMAVQAFKPVKRTRSKRGLKLVDWNYYNQHGVIRYMFNAHTDGIAYRVKWWIKPADAASGKNYSFRPSRPFKRKITEAIRQGVRYMDTDYEIYDY